MNIGKDLREILEEAGLDFRVRGVITSGREILPIGSDTKVLSKIFETLARPLVYQLAEKHDLEVHEAGTQTSYPDFTLMTSPEDTLKIAVDVKTTYQERDGQRVSFTLGSYTSFIRPGNEERGIEFPYHEYREEWVLGFIYERVQVDEPPAHQYSLEQLDEIPIPFDNVQFFVREKWKIAGDVAGAGNTTNIGSIRGEIDDFRSGQSLFANKEEFLNYWRGYRPTAEERRSAYGNITEFREQTT